MRPLRLGEGPAEVGGQSVDDPRAPAVLLLAGEDPSTYLPVEAISQSSGDTIPNAGEAAIKKDEQKQRSPARMGLGVAPTRRRTP